MSRTCGLSNTALHRAPRPDGTSHVADLLTHQPYARRAGVEHNVINANAFEFAFLEIELLR